MKIYLRGLLYRILIDPLLTGIRTGISNNTGRSDKVIDIACGPGTLAIELAKKSGHVTGIDLDGRLISYASERAAKKGIRNINLRMKDATHLSCYSKHEFDIAVTSMAVHQFEAQLAIKILSEMKRIASKVIIADYHYPMPAGFPGSMAFGIERMAAGDHYRNFKSYMAAGGIKYFTDAAGLSIQSSIIKGKGVFVIAICE